MILAENLFEKATDSTLYIHFTQNKLILAEILFEKATDSTLYIHFTQNKLILAEILFEKATDSTLYIHFTINFGESYLVPRQRRLTLESRTSYLANDD